MDLFQIEKCSKNRSICKEALLLSYRYWETPVISKQVLLFRNTSFSNDNFNNYWIPNTKHMQVHYYEVTSTVELRVLHFVHIGPLDDMYLQKTKNLTNPVFLLFSRRVANILREITMQSTVKPVLSRHSKIDKTKVLKTNVSIMNVVSISECAKRAFCNTLTCIK